MKFIYFFILLGILLLFGNTTISQPDSIRPLIAQLKKENIPYKKFELMFTITNYYYHNGSPDSMWKVGEHLMLIAQETKNDSCIMAAFKLVGNYCHLKGDYVGAIVQYFQAIHLAKHIKNGADIVAALYNNIGYNYNSLGYDSSALVYLTKADSVIKANGKDLPDVSVYVYENMAETYYAQKKLTEAERFLNLAVHENLVANDHYIESIIFMYTAKIYADLRHDSTEAIANFQRAVLNSTIYHDVKHFEIATMEFAKFYFKNANYILSKKYALESMDAAIVYNYEYIIVQDAELLRKIYTNERNNDSSFYYAIKEISYTDTLNNRQKKNQLFAISFDETTRELQQAAAYIEMKKQRSRNIQYFVIVIVLISFSALFILLSNNGYINKKGILLLGTIGLLITFEFINLYFHPFIQDITHDEPAFMLAILVVIAALLAKMHHFLENLIRKKLVEKNRKMRKKNAENTLRELAEEAP